jgi:hypothetical protein
MKVLHKVWHAWKLTGRSTCLAVPCACVLPAGLVEYCQRGGSVRIRTARTVDECGRRGGTDRPVA